MEFDEWYDKQEKLLKRMNKKSAVKMAWHAGRSLLLDKKMASQPVFDDELLAENKRLSKENTELKAGFQHIQDRQKKQAGATGARSRSKFGPVK